MIGLGRYKTTCQVAFAYVEGDIDLPVALYLFEEIEWDLPQTTYHTSSPTMDVYGVTQFGRLLQDMVSFGLDREPNGYSRVNVFRGRNNGVYVSVKRPSAWKRMKKDYYWTIGTCKELWPSVKIAIGDLNTFGTSGRITEFFTPKAPEDLGVHLRSMYHRWEQQQRAR